MNEETSDKPIQDGMAKLVTWAKAGDRDSLSRLAELAQPRLLAYLYRLTLNYDLAQELCQETLVKMVETIEGLENVDRFWPWLFRSAMGHVQHHFRDEKRRQLAHLAAVADDRFEDYVSRDHRDGLTRAARVELSQIVVDAMTQMKLVYRNILVLRCYDQLSYAEIAETLGCKELRARVLFFRAKHILKQHLSKRGFGKEVLLPALGLFGYLTIPPTKGASATTIGLAASAIEVGPLAAAVGAMGTKAGMAISASFGALAVGAGLDQLGVALTVLGVVLVCLVVGLYIEALSG
jgi:RNA polymerase sigma-70 factor (ECF subfamily)